MEVEPITNPNFNYRGSVIGLIGNLAAFNRNQRFINRDLNRQWTIENVNKAIALPVSDLNEELVEIKDLIEIITQTIQEEEPEKVIVLDLHTTSSHGGIFSISTPDEESIRIAIELHAPVIRGMLNGPKRNYTSLFYRRKSWCSNYSGNL